MPTIQRTDRAGPEDAAGNEPSLKYVEKTEGTRMWRDSIATQLTDQP